ncbi:iron-containing alcohol dehydrogenase family protein [Metabacillus herbersteinensis]|uniref:Iron-containing alcohol dehydrogenase family protein n=1 Tax=Metabacillus herbersteinensis TaxID=283816 RepID=A0ABV6GGD1_9BACI
MLDLEVRGAPSVYACEVGVLDQLDNLLLQRGIFKVLVLHGEKSWEVARTFFQKDSNSIHYLFEKYKGECSLQEISRICQEISSEKVDAIIGVGGGKVLDVAKAVANELDLEVILIPTLASTCAAWTPLSVLYDENGEFTHYTMFPRNTLMVLVEPRIILQSPPRLLKAGIADTLAKWYEAKAIIRNLPEKSLVIEIAYQTAKICKDELLQHGEQAIVDMEKGQLSYSFTKVIETNIVAGGMVGGFGDKYGRISGAHSVHNGLTTVPDTHHLLHGEKVGYGILVQLAMLEEWDEIDRLLPFYKTMDFPISLSDVGIKKNDCKTLSQVCKAVTLPHESIHLLKRDISKEMVYGAMLGLEKHIKTLSGNS